MPQRIRGFLTEFALPALCLVLGAAPAGAQAPEDSSALSVAIEAEPAVFEGTREVALRARGPSAPFAQVRWEIRRAFAFADEAPNPRLWIHAGASQREGALEISGARDWGTRFAFTRETFPRPSVLEAAVATPAGSQTLMVGFKNVGEAGDYVQYPYALYFNQGGLQVYESGANRGRMAAYAPGETLEVRIELRVPAGADYAIRRPGGAWTAIHRSGSGNAAAFRAGLGVHEGAFRLLSLAVARRLQGESVRAVLASPSEVSVAAADADGRIARDTLAIAGGAAPTARASLSPLPAEGHRPAILDARASGDDFGIAEARWDILRTLSFRGEAAVQADWVATPTAFLEDGRLLTRGMGAWGMTGVLSRETCPRPGALEALLVPPAGDAQMMIGFKNAGPANHYGQYPHALYFNGGNLQVYENGTNRGLVGTYAPGRPLEVRIDLVRPTGATYAVRPQGTAAWTTLYHSPSGADTALRAGWDVAAGLFQLERVVLRKEYSGLVAAVSLPAPATVIARLADSAGSLGRDTLRVSAGSPPAASARLEPPVLEGSGPVRLDGSASTDDGGADRHVWEWRRRFDFAGDSPDPSTWSFSSGVSQGGSLAATGAGAWDNRYAFSQAACGRPSSLRVTVETPASGAQNMMVGFKNAGAGASFNQYPYALYFNQGNLQVYENGVNRGVAGTYVPGGAYEVRIDLGQSSGAAFALRPRGSARWELLHQSPHGAEASLRVGMTVLWGRFAFDDWAWTLRYPAASAEAVLESPARLHLVVADGAGQVSEAAVDLGAGEAPSARAAVTPAEGEGLAPLVLDGRASTDDRGIVAAEWDLGVREFDLADSFFVARDWAASGLAFRHGRLELAGAGSWDNRHLVSRETFGRTSVLEASIRPPAGGHHLMVGFKDTSAFAHYRNFPYALYFDNGTIRIFENGQERHNGGTYPGGTLHEVRIVLAPSQGARYWVRQDGGAWILVHASAQASPGILRAGATAFSGTFSLERLCVERRMEGLQASASAFLPVAGVLTVRDGAGQTDTVAFAAPAGRSPRAVFQGPATLGVEVPGTFSALASTDDRGILSYRWDFGDGSAPVFAPSVTRRFARVGLHTVRLVVRDSAGQADTAVRTVEVNLAGFLRTVPWRLLGEREIPHDAISGRPVTLKAVAGTAALPLTYTWDFGDGSPAVTRTVGRRDSAFALEARHAYVAGEGTPFTAVVTVRDALGREASARYPVLVRDSSASVRTNLAIDEGLWYLHKAQIRSAAAESDLGHWAVGGHTVNATASALLAFQTNGHLESGDARRNPYVETVRRGMDHLLGSLRSATLSVQPAGNPDADGNGIGLDLAEERNIYQLGPVMDALVASGTPEALARTGGVNVRGRRYRDLVQDMADMYAFGQSDSAVGRARGGWRYEWNSASADNSAAQWAAIGLIPAERLWGVAVPAFVKAENRRWLAASSSRNANGCGFGYDGPGHGHNTTPSGMVQMAFHGSTTADSAWACAEGRMAAEWNAFLSANSVYGYFAFAKAMRLARPAPRTTLGPAALDWFDHPSRGLRAKLLGLQAQDGSWPSAAYGNVSDPDLNTAWAVSILTPTLFELPPVAVAAARPNPGAVGRPIRFEGGGSFHADPFRRIVSYAWDFDASDGVDWTRPDATGPAADFAYGALGTYQASLRVTDDQDPPHADVASLEVRVTVPPHPPTAVPGGPYVAVAGEAVALDGSGSLDVNASLGDSITAYGWETDLLNPRDYDDALGAKPTGVVFRAPGTYDVGLRVTDNTARAFPASGQPNLADEAYTQVNVLRHGVEGFAVRMKGSQVALTWTSRAGVSFSIRRSVSGTGTGYVEVGQRPEGSTAFVDYNVVQGQTYFYRVHASDGSASYALSIVPRWRSTNRAPVIATTPVTEATVGRPYAYDVNASDPDRQALTYVLDQAPAGMSINASTGLIAWTPAPAQEGLAPVSVRVTDGEAAVVQYYTIRVTPRPNEAPVTAFTAPDQAFVGQGLAFDGSASADADGDLPLRHAWSFGDGTTAEGAVATHAFAAEGRYVVTLFVTDARGATGRATHSVEVVRPNRAPSADAGGPYLGRAGESIAFDGSRSTDPDGEALAFAWDFGDGSPAEPGPYPARVFAREGTYQGFLVVADGAGNRDTVAFTVIVTAPNLRPTASLRAESASGNVGDTFRFDGSASRNPDGGSLLLAWDFGDGVRMEGQAVTHAYAAPGRYRVVLAASDPEGAVDSAFVEIHVNAPPAFTSEPSLSVLQGEPYAYAARAVDPDGDTLSFSLVLGPAEMALDPATGRLAWTPGQSDVGFHDVGLVVDDGKGRFASQAFRLEVRNVNDAPRIVSRPPARAARGAAYAYRILADDPDGDALAFRLEAGPAGMTVTPEGLLAWPDDGARPETAAVAVVVEDVAGASARQAWTVVVVEDREPPAVALRLSRNPASVGDSVIVTVEATDDVGLAAVELRVDGSLVALDGSGAHVLRPAAEGGIRLSARAVDFRGAEASAAEDLRVRLPLPPVRFAGLADGARVGSPLALRGTIEVPGEWRAEYRSRSGSEWTRLGSGASPVSDAYLGTFDPTLLLNGLYEIRLTATPESGEPAAAAVTVSVEGGLKLGHFSLSYTDLELPVHGIPMEIVRTYDTREKRSGDFGYGWSLEVGNLRVEESEALGRGWRGTRQDLMIGPYFCLEPVRPHIVSIRMPDGRLLKFEAVVEDCTLWAPHVWSPRLGFRPMAGTVGRLEALELGPISARGAFPGLIELHTGSPPAPVDPAVYRLTLENGTEYVIDQVRGLRTAKDLNGNTLTVGREGITHSTGRAIAFDRDADGRIVAVRDPAGHATTYAYEDGNLVRATDAEGNVTRFAYDASRRLSEVVDPRGNRAIRNEYGEDGRLVRQIDAGGNATEFAHDAGGRREIVRDRLGHPTVREYDADGNLARRTDPLGHVTTWEYDVRGNKLSETDALGNTTRYTYDSLDRLIRRTGPSGDVTSYSYNRFGSRTSETDPLGRTVSLAYGPKGELLSVKDREGNVTRFDYDWTGRPLRKLEPHGRVTEYAFDDQGGLARIEEASGRVTLFLRDANLNVLEERVIRPSERGNDTLVTRYAYDRLNRQVAQIDPEGGRREWHYDAGGRDSLWIDPSGRRTSFHHDALGRRIRVTYPDGSSTEAAYDAESRQVLGRNAAGGDTLYAYDPGGELSRITYPDGHSVSFQRDPLGRVTARTDEQGHTTRSEYDPACGCADRRTAVVQPSGATWTYGFDAAGNLVSARDPAGKAWRYAYDGNDRLLSVTAPDGQRIESRYDSLGREVVRREPDGAEYQYAYDLDGNLASVTDPLGASTVYAYDGSGNLVSIRDARGNTTRFEYDLVGNRIRRSLPLGQSEAYRYDRAGNLVGKVGADGTAITLEYDAMDRLRAVTPAGFAGAIGIRYAYGSDGLLSSVEDESGRTDFAYDARGRLILKRTPAGDLAYGYDEVGNLISARSSNAGGYRVRYRYDADRRLISVADSLGGETRYGYDPAGRLVTTSLPNGIAIGHAYDESGRLRTVTAPTVLPGVPGDAGLGNFGYLHDAAGRRIAEVRGDGRRIDFRYDPAGRLSEESFSGGKGPIGAVAYDWDPAGNRIRRLSSLPFPGSREDVYDANDRIPGIPFDARGNQLESEGLRLAFDFLDNLQGTDDGSLLLVRNAFGDWVGRTEAGRAVAYLVDALTPSGHSQIVEEISGGRVAKVYVFGHSPISQADVAGAVPTIRYYGMDGMGTVRYLTDGDGRVTDTYEFDSQGNLLAQEGTSRNPLLYRSQYLDSVLGLYYMRARHYDPGSGRFLGLDPFFGEPEDPLTLHKYLYAKADAVNYWDPEGTAATKERGVLSGLSATAKGALACNAVGFAMWLIANVASPIATNGGPGPGSSPPAVSGPSTTGPSGPSGPGGSGPIVEQAPVDRPGMPTEGPGEDNKYRGPGDNKGRNPRIPPGGGGPRGGRGWGGDFRKRWKHPRWICKR